MSCRTTVAPPLESRRLALFSRREKRILFAFAQAFTACATLLLLTSTVMHRPDEDGYQAAHLFFMPRGTWEMDQGRGMLHGEEYYRDIDERATLEETYGVDADYFEERGERAQEQSEEAGEPSNIAEMRDEPYDEPPFEQGQGEEGSLFNSHKPVLRRMPRPRPFISNELPTIQPVEECLHGAIQPIPVGEPAVYFADWQPDVPSPPPRKRPA
jgi:hypothetical protein